MATTRADGTVVPTVIAKQDVEVPDPNAPEGVEGFNRRIVAGQPVPPELLDGYYAATGETPDDGASADSAEKAQKAPARDKAQKAPSTSK